MRYFTSCLQNGVFLPVEINTGENDTSVYASQKNARVRLDIKSPAPFLFRPLISHQHYILVTL